MYLACLCVSAAMAVGLTSCTTGDASTADNADSASSADITYQHLSGEDVKALLDSDESVLLVDVRQPLAFEYEHIEGAINVPQDQIAQQAESVFPDKDQTIILYCDYGGVSKIAAEDMVDMGYTGVIEFDGLEDWPGETVKNENVK